MSKFCLFIGLTVLAVAGFWWLNTPAKGAIINGNINLATPTPVEYIRVEGQGLSFAYENKYELNGEDGKWLLVGKQGVLSQITVRVSEAKSAEIEDVSGVQLRRVKSEEYGEGKIEGLGTEGLWFKRKDLFEETAFFLEAGKEVTVAMSANTVDDGKMEEEFKRFVKSLVLR